MTQGGSASKPTTGFASGENCPPQWSVWFDGPTISHEAAGDTILIGGVAD